MERMDFKSFCNAVVNGIAEYLLQYEIESIRLETVCHNNGVEHVGLDLVPERASASAFGNRQTLKVNTGRAVKIANFHVVKADGFQNRTPHHRLIVTKRQTQEAAALLIVDILTAGKVRKEQNTVGAHRNLSGSIIQIVVVNRVIGLVADIVFKPAQS